MHGCSLFLYGADSKKDSRERLSFLPMGEIVIFYRVKDNYFSPACQGCDLLLFPYIGSERGKRKRAAGGCPRGRGEILIFYIVKDKYFSRTWQGVSYVNFH